MIRRQSTDHPKAAPTVMIKKIRSFTMSGIVSLPSIHINSLTSPNGQLVFLPKCSKDCSLYATALHIHFKSYTGVGDSIQKEFQVWCSGLLRPCSPLHLLSRLAGSNAPVLVQLYKTRPLVFKFA